jgi:hypothetical protein
LRSQVGKNPIGSQYEQEHQGNPGSCPERDEKPLAAFHSIQFRYHGGERFSGGPPWLEGGRPAQGGFRPKPLLEIDIQAAIWAAGQVLPKPGLQLPHRCASIDSFLETLKNSAVDFAHLTGSFQ